MFIATLAVLASQAAAATTDTAALEREARVRAELQANPASARLSYEFAKLLSGGPRSKARNEEMTYYVVRAAWIEGNDPIPAAVRDPLRTVLKMAFSGPVTDFADWVASATSPQLDRTKFRIPRIIDDSSTGSYHELCKRIRSTLIHPADGPSYWQQVKGSALPRFRGKVISVSPRELLVAI